MIGYTKQANCALFARQEIYDTQGSVCAYELLYRAGDHFSANIDSTNEQAGDDATSYVLSHLFTHLDINVIIGKYPAYINFTRNHLLQQLPALLPKKRIVIELLENIPIDNLLLESLQTLLSKGYKLALDDFIFREELTPLVEMANIIKIEVLHLNKKEIKNRLAPMSDFKGKFLAEKIENREQLILCKDLGFDLFQGYFLNYPHLIHGQAPEMKIHLFQMLAELYNSETQLERIEGIISKVSNCNKHVLNIAEAENGDRQCKLREILIAEPRKTRDWISLCLIAAVENLAHSLLERTLIRARMCQILAEHSALACPFKAYTVGMLSTLDAILNLSMDVVLEKLYLDEEISEALLNRQGQLGYLLNMTQAYEQANFNKLDNTTFTAKDYSLAYRQGIEHANHMIDLIS